MTKPKPKTKRKKLTSAERLAANVKRIRDEKQLTQRELAEVCNLSQPRIAEIEAGQGDPKLSTLDTLSNATRTPPAEFFL